MEALWAVDSKVIDQIGNVSLTPDESRVRFGKPDRVGVAKLHEALTNPHIVPDNPRPEDTTATDAVELFANGHVLLMRNWAIAYQQLTDRQEDLDRARVTFRTAAPPTPSVLGGQNLAVSAHTDKPRATRALIEFLASAQSQLILSEIGGFAPTRSSVYDRVKGEHFENIFEALKNARPRPAVRHYTEFSQRFRNGVRHPLSDDDGIARELAEILRR